MARVIAAPSGISQPILPDGGLPVSARVISVQCDDGTDWFGYCAVHGTSSAAFTGLDDARGWACPFCAALERYATDRGRYLALLAKVSHVG